MMERPDDVVRQWRERLLTVPSGTRISLDDAVWSKGEENDFPWKRQEDARGIEARILAERIWIALHRGKQVQVLLPEAEAR
jgi:hypothetical protein